MTKIKPTGYELTVDAKSMYLLCRLIGATTIADTEKLGATEAEDSRLSKLFCDMKDKLEEDGNWYG